MQVGNMSYRDACEMFILSMENHMSVFQKAIAFFQIVRFLETEEQF